MMSIVLAAFNFYGQWYGWLPLSLLAIVAAVLVHNIILMFARAFNIRELEAYAKSEMLQAAATAFMAIFLVLMVDSTMNISQSLISGEIQCAGKAQHIGQDTPQSTMDDAYKAIRCRMQQRAKAVAEIQDAITADSGPEYQSTETIRITNNIATVLLIALNAQSFLLEYLRLNMLHVFVPVGILLRSFYFTRAPGALFISIGIGMYFIFPIFFVLLDPGFVPSAPPPVTTPSTQQYCYQTMSNAVSLVTTLEAKGLGSSANLQMASIRNELSKSYISLILHPLVALFLTMIFVRYMMSILGGDTYELAKMMGKVI
jgi:hypothetical protein